LRLFVDAMRKRDHLSARAPSALASDLHNRAGACELVAVTHCFRSFLTRPFDVTAKWTTAQLHTGSKRAATGGHSRDLWRVSLAPMP
jgi:hypothetical protein